MRGESPGEQPRPWVVWFDSLSREDVALAGGKGANLGEMTQAGLPVPRGFVVTLEAFQAAEVVPVGLGDVVPVDGDEVVPVLAALLVPALGALSPDGERSPESFSAGNSPMMFWLTVHAHRAQRAVQLPPPALPAPCEKLSSMLANSSGSALNDGPGPEVERPPDVRGAPRRAPWEADSGAPGPSRARWSACSLPAPSAPAPPPATGHHTPRGPPTPTGFTILSMSVSTWWGWGPKVEQGLAYGSDLGVGSCRGARNADSRGGVAPPSGG